MEREAQWHELDLEEQLDRPWDWHNDHGHLDGWRLNDNRVLSNKYLMELGSELGPISIPHRYRRFRKLT